MNTSINQNSGRRHGRAGWMLALLVAALGAGPALAEGKGPCSARTMRGVWGFQMQGTRPVIPPNGQMEEVVGLALRNYDGYGNFTQVDNIKGSATGITPDRSGAGTYEVAADCTGTTSFQPNPDVPEIVIVERFLLLENGEEVLSIVSAPQALMITAIGHRVRTE